MPKQQSSNQSTQTVKAVELMRQIREKLSREYQANPDQETRELDAIRTKYQMQQSTKA